MSEPLAIVVTGAAGRMGQAVIRLAPQEGARVVGALDRSGSPSVGRDAGEVAGIGIVGVEVSADVGASLLGAACVIDFSAASAVAALASAAARAGVAIVTGTTGLGDDAVRALDKASEKVPVLAAPNMSLGVHVLAEIVRAAVKALPGYDVEIVETHHRKKIDAPSGTALRLLDAVKDAREARAVYGREGKPGARMADEVGVLALRGGDVIGDHTVHLLGDGERIELTHRATSRDLFARGALAAARVIARKPPGRYTIADVVAGQ
ncbi:MAG TPA: 4-hydroxy-tetrahydrodipicolinate reductase [Polyangiaceae bacterium]|nr:4-hydroxy-tetrahydrodipicolinate reductase [Polyangiaceae bacterium]